MKKILTLILIFLTIGLITIKVSAASTYDEWAKNQDLAPYVKVDTELRAVWVATVYNLDIKKQSSATEDGINEWKNQYLKILDTVQSYNLNTIIFQVRPCNDAFYPSKYNPWSEYLYSYGKDPGWDPLEWMIEVTHERGMEYHAWMNPYRASTSANVSIVNNELVIDYDDTSIQNNKKEVFSALKNKSDLSYDNTPIDNPVFATGDELKHNVVLGTGNQYVLNPASETTITHLENTIREVVENYDIDGIHFDDYFYPDDKTYAQNSGTNSDFKGLTFSTESLIDWADYQTYRTNGGKLNIYDWRRNNVDTLIERLDTLITSLNENRTRPCAFGISPGAYWAPSIESCPAGSTRPAEGGMNLGCNNYYSYSDLYADTKKWVDNEWIDYILPQAYTNLVGNYTQIVSWWSDAMKNSPVKLYIGTGLYQIDTWKNTGDEIYYQIRYNQSENNRVDGYSMYDYSSLTEGTSKTAIQTVKTLLWDTNALTPLYNGYDYKHTVSGQAVEKRIIETSVSFYYDLEYEKIPDAKAYVLYELTQEENLAYLAKEKELTSADIKVLNLSGKNKFRFKYDENNVYYMATVSQDNTFYVNEKPVDFSKIEVNLAPTVTLVSDFYSKALVDTNIKFRFKIEDQNQDEFTYKIYLMYRGKSELTPTILDDGTIEVSWKTYSVSTPGVKVIVEATDGKATTNYETEMFDVVSECEHNLGEATCTAAPKCNDCGTLVGQALGHNFVGETCTIKGICSRCSEESKNEPSHNFGVATCKNPSTCSKCGQTTGEALAHIWNDATCENPKTCIVCGTTEGNKLEHSWTEATEDEPKTCSKCGTTEGEPLPKKKGCGSCNKSMLSSVLLFNAIVVTIAILLKKRGK